MPATLKVDISQIKELIQQLDIEEKKDLSKYLDKLTLKTRLKDFINSKRDVPLTIEEITAEVEKVREERYR
jgi:hypothetical protein